MNSTKVQVKRRHARIDLSDSVRTGPGTLAGQYMRMFWQPVYRGKDLPHGQAKPLRIMGEDFTLYRGENGAAHMLDFRCAHRGTQLSVGWVEGDEIRCFYHGWKYDASGQCIEQPGEPKPFCKKIRIRSYPVDEYLGLIFAYLGEGDPPPLPRYPDFEREEGREANIYVRRCNFFNNLDNDNVHVYFVHRRPGVDFQEWKGNIPTSTEVEDEWGVARTNIKPRGRSNVTRRGMPNMKLRKEKPGSPTSPRSENSIAWHVPIDDESHYAVQVDVALQEGIAPRPTDSKEWVDPNDVGELILAAKLSMQDVEWDSSPAYARVRRELLVGKLPVPDTEWLYTDKVKVQDVVSQVGQGRIPDRSAEHLGHTDSAVILLRKIWERELRALAEGRPLKQWFRPEHHVSGQ